MQLRTPKPGILGPVFHPTTRQFNPNVIDPSHPAAAGSARIQLPSWRHEAVGIRLIPSSLLGTPPIQPQYPFKAPFVPWAQRVEDLIRKGYTARKAPGAPPEESDKTRRLRKQEERYFILDPDGNSLPPTTQVRAGRLFDQWLAEMTLPPLRLSVHAALSPEGLHSKWANKLRRWAIRKLERRLPMSMAISTSIARQGKPRVVRRVQDVKLKTALNWIVVRGARVVMDDEDPLAKKIVFNTPSSTFNAQHDPKSWVMQGWTYVFYPTIELYRMPRADVVEILSEGLKIVNRRASTPEYTWLAKALVESQSNPPPKSRGRTPPPELTSPPTITNDAQLELLSHLHDIRSSASNLNEHVRSKHIYQYPRKTTVDPGEGWRKEMLASIQLLRQGLEARSGKSELDGSSSGSGAAAK